jgi:hypothetical protein
MSAIWLTIREFLTSKKFIVAVAGLIVTALAKLHFEVPETLVQEFVGILIAYLLAQGWADRGKEAAKVDGTIVLATNDLSHSSLGNAVPRPVKDKLI